MVTTVEFDAVPVTPMEAAAWAASLACEIDYEAAMTIADELGHAAMSAQCGGVALTNAQRMRDALLTATRQRRH